MRPQKLDKYVCICIEKSIWLKCVCIFIFQKRRREMRNDIGFQLKNVYINNNKKNYNRLQFVSFYRYYEICKYVLQKGSSFSALFLWEMILLFKLWWLIWLGVLIKLKITHITSIQVFMIIILMCCGSFTMGWRYKHI